MKKIYLLILMLLLIPSVYGQQGHLKLLAVTETEDGYKGSTADLYLNIQPGSGRIFLETFPLTKFDTQISTRFAKEIACNYIDVDCTKYDFFYTINAESPIIAGASAGSSIAILTISILKNIELDEKVAITGTMNSGGLIGPVGGLKEKIEAAKDDNIDVVLIPKYSKLLGEDNETFDIENLSKELDIKIVEVSTLDDAIMEFSGEEIIKLDENITISTDYSDTMKYLADVLCIRAEELLNVTVKKYINKTNSLQRAINLTERGLMAYENKYYYSSASHCFGANVEFSYSLLHSENLTINETLDKVELLRESIENLDETLNKNQIKTITDLEAYMIVKERLKDANDFLDSAEEKQEVKTSSLHDLAYAIERLNSAKSWATFLDNRGREFVFNDEVLESSCKFKLLEAEERYQYVKLYFPTSLENTRKEIDYAYEDLEEKNFALCIFKASKAKANMNIILGTFYVNEEQVKNMVNQKLDIVKKNLIKETQKGIFPILGYSYYEYASTLEGYDLYSALIYSEYALELSNLEVYFKEKSNIILEDIFKARFYGIVLILSGFILGYVIALIQLRKRLKKR